MAYILTDEEKKLRVDWAKQLRKEASEWFTPDKFIPLIIFIHNKMDAPILKWANDYLGKKIILFSGTDEQLHNLQKLYPSFEINTDYNNLVAKSNYTMGFDTVICVNDDIITTYLRQWNRKEIKVNDYVAIWVYEMSKVNEEWLCSGPRFAGCQYGLHYNYINEHYKLDSLSTTMYMLNGKIARKHNINYSVKDGWEDYALILKGLKLNLSSITVRNLTYGAAKIGDNTYRGKLDKIRQQMLSINLLQTFGEQYVRLVKDENGDIVNSKIKWAKAIKDKGNFEKPIINKDKMLIDFTVIKIGTDEWLWCEHVLNGEAKQETTNETEQVIKKLITEQHILYRKFIKDKKLYEYKLKTTNKPRLLSGHRAVYHAGFDEYSNDLYLLLNYFGLAPKIKENIFMKVGTEYENLILKTQDKNIKQYLYEETKGDMFSHDEISGEIDGYSLKNKMLYECKTFYSLKRINENKYQNNKWYIQSLLYLYGWNHDVSNKLREPIKGIRIVAYYIPFYHVQDAIKNPNKKIPLLTDKFIDNNNIYTFDIVNDDRTKDLAERVINRLLLKRKKIIETKIIYSTEQQELIEELIKEKKIKIIYEQE